MTQALNIFRAVTENWHLTPVSITIDYAISDEHFQGLGIYQGYFILDPVEDIPNNKFESLEDGRAYYDNLAWSSILSQINSYPNTGLTFVQGDIVDFKFPEQGKFDSIDSEIDSVQNDITALQSSVSSHNHTAADVTDFEDSVESVITAQKGVSNGLASLDSNGLVPAAQLPSFVDDVLEYANFAALPGTGESGKIYVLATPYNGSSQYRWSGSAYAAIVASPGTSDAVTEGSTNKYFTDARAQAAAKMYEGGTLRTGVFPIAKEATVSGGNAVFHLTDDELSTGNALFSSTPYLKSLMLTPVEADSPVSFGTPVLSNSNKTLTVPVKKAATITTLPIIGTLTGALLGAPVAANGTTIRMLMLAK